MKLARSPVILSTIHRSWINCKKTALVIYQVKTTNLTIFAECGFLNYLLSLESCSF